MTVWYSRRTSGKEVAPESGGQPPDFFLQVPDAVVLFPCVMQIGYYGPLPPCKGPPEDRGERTGNSRLGPREDRPLFSGGPEWGLVEAKIQVIVLFFLCYIAL